jgi:hypothetical protein
MIVSEVSKKLRDIYDAGWEIDKILILYKL